MTDDDMVEAMQDAIAAELQRLVPGCISGTCSNPAGCGGPQCGNAEIYAHHLARAAIRACHAAGGLVLREVPPSAADNHSMGLWGDG